MLYIYQDEGHYLITFINYSDFII